MDLDRKQLETIHVIGWRTTGSIIWKLLGIIVVSHYFLRTGSARGMGVRCQTFFFPCSAHHERDWPPCKVVFFGLATNALNVCSMYGHTYSESMDQPGKVASPARGQLNRKNEYFPVSVRA